MPTASFGDLFKTVFASSKAEFSSSRSFIGSLSRWPATAFCHGYCSRSGLAHSGGRLLACCCGRRRSRHRRSCRANCARKRTPSSAPRPFKPTDGRCREASDRLADQGIQRLVEIVGGYALRIQPGQDPLQTSPLLQRRRQDPRLKTA